MMNHEEQNQFVTQPIFNCTIWSNTKQNYYNWSNWANMLVNTQIPATARCPEDDLYHLHLILLNLICVCAADGRVWTKMICWCLRSEVNGLAGPSRHKVKCLAAHTLEAQMGHSRTLPQGCCSRQRTTATTTARAGSAALGRERDRNEPAVMLTAVMFGWPGPNFDTFERWIHPVLKHWLGVVSDLSMEDIWTVLMRWPVMNRSSVMFLYVKPYLLIPSFQLLVSTEYTCLHRYLGTSL